MNNLEKMDRPKGEISMVLHKGGTYNPKTGKVEGGEILKEQNVKNLIVDRASVLMACRLAPGAAVGSGSSAMNGTWPTATDGLQYLAVGWGPLQNPAQAYDPTTNPVLPSWPLQNPPAETGTATKLTGECYRKEFTSWTFATDSADSGTPTNILKLVTTFDEGEAAGPLTEMGIFGGNAQTWNNGLGKDTGYMFNYKTFPVNIQAAC